MIAHTSGSWLAIAYLLVRRDHRVGRSVRPRRVDALEISESVVPDDLFLVGLQMGVTNPSFVL